MLDAFSLPKDLYGIDHFPVGCFATDDLRIIRFANAEAAVQVGRPRTELPGLHVEVLLTPASRIFCDSYVYPILLTEGRCEEIALTIATGSGSRLPVVANARIHERDPDLVLWSMMRADKRDKLQGEVLSARNQLQRQTRSLKELASRDELTGLFNRREATRRIGALMRAADEAGAEVTVLLLDIDRFKTVNDTYGHDAGDAVLRQLGAALASMVRSHEIVGRYGGEEFILAIAAADDEAVRSLNRRVHAAAASVTGSGAPLTVSVGLCCRPVRVGQSLDQLVKAADRALYEAKALGRNRSIIEIDRELQPYD